jgi:hypothetical protein
MRAPETPRTRHRPTPSLCAQPQSMRTFSPARERRHTRPVSQRTLVSAAGLWADLDVDINSEDIDEARREMWGNFPREDI